MRLSAAHVLVLIAAVITALVVYLAFFADNGASDLAEPVDAADPSAAPSLQLDADQVHLGTVSNREPTTARVTVRNAGKAPLEIRDIRTSCACTQGKMSADPAVIPPGGADTLEITFYPKRVYGFHSHKVLTLFTNDPVRPAFELHVLADVDPEFELVPEEVDFGAVPKGSGASRTVRFRPLQPPVSHVTGISTAQPGKNAEGMDPTLRKSWLRLEQLEVPPAEWRNPDFPEVDIRVTIDPAAPPGELKQPFYISVDTPRFPFMMVPVSAVIEAPYEVQGDVSQGQIFIRPGEPPAKVRFRSKSGPLNPVEVVPDPPGIVEPALQQPENGGIELILVPVKGLSPGKHTVELRVRLRGADDAVLEELFFAHVYVPGGA